jgi:protection-of-telomeres protein 1
MASKTYLLDQESTQDVVLPFVNANYKCNVRVIGYFPHKIEDFAVGRRVTDLDMLSDYSGSEDGDLDEDTDSEEGRNSSGSSKQSTRRKWEWRFALEVKDADSKVSEDRMWLYIDNHAGQALLDLDAAK